MAATLIPLFVAGLLCWFLSSIAAGGGAVLFLPVARLVLEPQDVPPAIAVASVISSAHRSFLYRSDVVLRIWAANVPGLLAGTVLGALLLKNLQADWLGYLVGGFLVFLAIGHFAGNEMRFRNLTPWHFAGMSFVTASVSTVVGVAGPLMNPLYVGGGILKEAMIGTKAASTIFMQAGKIVAFAGLGLLGPEILILGAVIGVGALLGNWLGRHALASLTSVRFTHYVYAALLLSGLATLFRTATG